MTTQDIKKALMTCSVDSCKDCPYDNTGLYCCGKLKRDALALITEQENEIERLKEENGQSRKSGTLGYNATIEFHDDVVSEPSADYKDIEKYAKQFRNRIISINEKEIKQAKIDVLNKVKVLIFQKDNPYAVPFEEFVGANVFCGYIDEMIKEVENE